MEVAAKTVELLSQRILPEKPHQLSYSADWRYRLPHDDDPRSKHCEEWYNTRLQYLTLVSEADRGVLLTRSYYDMREEPPKPVPKEVSALAKGAGLEKKKLSLSDYKNKKTGVASASPPEPAIAKRKESERASTLASIPPSASTPEPQRPSYDSAKKQSQLEARRPDKTKSRGGAVVDMSLPPKPPPKNSLPPRPPSPSGKKRTADIDDESRPQKRTKPELGRPTDTRHVKPRDDGLRRKEKPTSTSRDAQSNYEDKAAALSNSLPNGRAVIKTVTSTNRNPSPIPRPRGDPVNGLRSTSTSTGSTKNTPPKHDAPPKASVPPLLSPLHLTFDSHSRRRDEEYDTKTAKKRRDEADDPRSPTKPKKKKESSPVILPPLLSPTLPPAVEAALSRKQKLSPDSEDDGEPSNAKKRLPVDSADEEVAKKAQTQRKRLVVTLTIPKKLRQTVRRILALSSGQPQRRDTQEYDDFSDDPPQQRLGKKRPIAASDRSSESISAKRPRASDVSSSSRLPAPSTPSKQGTAAMSRVSSTNSVAQTPGEAVNATPLASGPVDHRPNGPDNQNPDRPEVKLMKDRETRFNTLGRRLKHGADVAMNKARGSPSADQSRRRDSGMKLGYVLSLESIIAFMLSFQAQNTHRSLCSKRGDPTGWTSMFPLMEFLQKDMRRQEASQYRPLYALLLLLQVVSIDELRKCYGTLDNAAPNIAFQDLLRHERTRARLIPHIREMNDNIDSPNLRADATILSTLEEITESALRILRRWCVGENVDWSPEVNVKDSIAKAGVK